MSFDELDENDTEIGRIEISLRITSSGEIKTGYGFEGVSPEAAIGHLMIVLDRMREVRKYAWDTDAEDEALADEEDDE